MKLSKYEKLKSRFETLYLEKNFFSLNLTLYLFSFVGNIFLIYFGYFFIKSITDTLPPLFPYQNAFFTIFIALFLTGYELTKRFVLEQTATVIVSIKRISLSAIVGLGVSLVMIIGSFYLSLNGAHRLVDSSERITISIDSVSMKRGDSILKYYTKEINFYRSQSAKTRVDRLYRDSIVSELQSQLDAKLSQSKKEIQSNSKTILNKNSENDTAFLFMTFFLEIIIVLGVGFNAFYTIGTYEETGKLLQTPKYKQYLINLKLLKVYFNNGKKGVGELAISINKMNSISKIQKLNVSPSEIKDFITLCSELDIVVDSRNRRKQYNMSYEDALKVIKKDEII